MTMNRLHLWPLSVAVSLIATVSLGLIADDQQSGKSTRFSEHLIKSGYSYSYGLAAADLDGDGDLDLTSADTRVFKLYWFENDGKGNFKEH